MLSPGEIVATSVKLQEGGPESTRAVVVLYEDYSNVVVAGMTSNPYVKGIPVTRKEGAPKDSVIKLNSIFTVDREKVSKPLFRLSKEKKKLLLESLIKLLSGLEY